MTEQRPRRAESGRARGNIDETHISAQQNQACAHARFSCPHGDESRTPRFKASSRQGPRTAHAVSRITALPTGTSTGLTERSGNRFTKDQRLLDGAAFGRVFDRATRSRDRLFTVLCRPNDSDVARLGLAISRKHCRRAVGRNRIKRVVRESFRAAQSALAGIDVVVINQPAAATADNETLFASLEKHWQACRKAKQAGPGTDG